MVDIKRFLLIAMLGISLNPVSVMAADDETLENLSNKLIALRGEVEDLNSEINLRKAEHKQDMSYLWSQKNETQAGLDSTQKLIDRLQADLEKKIEENREKGETSETLKPVFMAQVDEVERYIQQSIPFKKQERLADLQDVKNQVSQNLISTQRGFNKLWSLVEDEIRLTRETGLYQQAIQVEGEASQQLVDIVRLGMMTMYFETPEGEFGQLTNQGQNWVFKIVSDREKSKQIEQIFDSLNKQVRTGLFTLPMSSK